MKHNQSTVDLSPGYITLYTIFSTFNLVNVKKSDLIIIIIKYCTNYVSFPSSIREDLHKATAVVY